MNEIKKWWLTREVSYKGKEVWSCNKCSDTGLIMSLEFRQTTFGRKPYEFAYYCDCKRAKKYAFQEEKKDKLILGRMYADKYEYGFQFPYSEKIMKSREPKITYGEIYLIYVMNFFKAYKKNSEAGVDCSLDVLKREYPRLKI